VKSRTQSAGRTPAAVRDFLQSLRDRGAANNTIEAYQSDLEQLVGFLKSYRQGTGWNRLDNEAIEKFVRYLEHSGYRDSSVARKLVSLRGFLAFLAEVGAVPMTLAQDVRHPIEGIARTQALSADEAHLLFKLAGERSTAEGRRDRAMLELLYATGMRVSELVSLDAENLKIDAASPYVLCQGPRGKKRAIPIGDETVAVLRDYLMVGRPALLHTQKERSFFVSQHGRRLTRQGFWFILKGYARAARLTDVSPRTFRAAFASRALGSGMTEGNMHTMLGHSPGPTAPGPGYPQTAGS
jgi:integrase/recombinase XerD